MKNTGEFLFPCIGKSQATTAGLRVLLLMAMISIFSFSPSQVSAQDTTNRTKVADTIRTPEHSPKKATIYSAVLPGLGQAYNHKYWKMPIVYAGFATTIYFVSFNTGYYKDFRDAYSFKTNSNATGDPPNELVNKYTADQLLTGREYYRRNLELSYIATGVWYILNIVDATVDAHFYHYNINDDLSMMVKPWVAPPYQGYGGGSGLSLAFRF